MAEIIDRPVCENGLVTLMARIVDQSNGNILQAEINTVTYTVYLMDDQNPDSGIAVAEHSNVTLTVADVIFDTLQIDPIWTVDAVGYNFRHVFGWMDHPAFTVVGRWYEVDYQLTPAVVQMILVRFRIYAR